MKEFYTVEHKRNLKASHRVHEFVEYDINTLIQDEAELIVDADDDVTDEKWEEMVKEKAKEIKEELMQYGRWKNEFGHLVFLYF